MRATLLAIALLPALAFGQPPQTTKNVDLPTILGVPATNNIPFGLDQVRYQQFYSGAQFAQTIKQPVRFIGVEFFGAPARGTAYDVEITVANTAANLGGFFEQNFVSNRVTVLKRTTVVPPASATTLRFDFTTEHFKWDGSSNVVIDFRIFANGLNQAYNYSATSTVSTISGTYRQYTANNPNATTATGTGSTGHYGLLTRFLYQEGGTYDFGAGCPGGMNTIPVGSTNAVPLPGLTTYTQNLDQAGSGYPAVFVLGVSNTMWNAAPLPFSLGFLYAPNCNLLVSPDLYAFTTTVGGGPGSGSAKLATPIPAIGSLAGNIIYTQWLVLDKAAPNGNLAATAGLMQVVGS